MKYNSEVNVRIPSAMKRYLSRIAKGQSTPVMPVSTSDIVRQLIYERMPDEIRAEMANED